MLERIKQLSKRLDYHMQVNWVKQLQQLDLDHMCKMKLSNPKHQKDKSIWFSNEGKLGYNYGST
jgi:hypothetical protein